MSFSKTNLEESFNQFRIIEQRTFNQVGIERNENPFPAHSCSKEGYKSIH